MTHGPPLGILDGGQGDLVLRQAVVKLKPRLHCFGHVHAAYGTLATKNTLFADCAVLDKDGAPSNKPILLDLKEK